MTDQYSVREVDCRQQMRDGYRYEYFDLCIDAPEDMARGSVKKAEEGVLYTIGPSRAYIVAVSYFR